MSKPAIVCIDDQRDVLASLERDLADFEPFFSIITCESASEALDVLDEFAKGGIPLVLIVCDHVMPEKNGIDFLIEINQDPRFPLTKMILVTGLASHQDTITAINQAGIDRYIEKPWEKEQLLKAVKELITKFLLENGIEFQPYLPVLDQSILFQTLRKTT